MFDSLSERLSQVFRNLSGRGRLTEENIQEAIGLVRIALLEADVALSVVRDFIAQVESQALGQSVSKSLTPGQEFIRIVNHELIKIMGEHNYALNLACPAPAVILLAGLQGCGKTTTAAKLALFIKENLAKSVMLVSTDVYRPAAIEQLATLANEIKVSCYPADPKTKPSDIARAALQQAKQQGIDVLLVDTAGRLHIDDLMMAEIKELHQVLNPIETMFVVDSMTGQDAANTARAFHEALPLTGIILTKADGDSRGGAALSVRCITGKPIKFIGTGEKVAALDPFYPDRIASRILGMGDVLSLIEDVQRKIDHTSSEKLAKKLKKGKTFDLQDFSDQMRQMQKMGSLSGLLDKLPGTGAMKEMVSNQFNDKKFKQLIAIIDSMTMQEKRFPHLIRGSRKKRIAAGSGTQIQDVNRLLKQFDQMQKVFKKVGKKGGMEKMFRGMQNFMPGRDMPPDF